MDLALIQSVVRMDEPIVQIKNFTITFNFP
jgi:hypothetical protein